MIIYNQTSTSKKYLSGILIGFLILPAIYLFTIGLVLYGIVLILIYLAFETSRSGVDFDFDNRRFNKFREILFFIRIRQTKSTDLNSFSHYRINMKLDEANVSANWAQQSTVSQEHHSLELFNKQKGDYVSVLKNEIDQIKPLLVKLEEQNITVKD